MQILKPGVEPQRFFDAVRAASRRVLMLDYDGTLAPFRLDRDQAAPYPGVRERLSALMAGHGTRVVLISGRTAHEVLQLAAVEPAPEVWGTHGWERLSPDGTYELAPLPPAAEAGLAQAHDVLDVRWAQRLERKPASLAFHLRGLAPQETDAVQGHVQHAWEAIAACQGLEVHAFDGGIELRIPGRSKGTAVRQLLAESDPATVSAYLGDDRTDEDAFEAIAPHGLGVLVRPELRETAAAWWIKPPEELLDFLDQWIAACRQGT
ncbi:MAG TPA: trehalose-phosphatase [bacterium]|nr:trehalose-phosphatase [bacterium]